MKVPYKIKKLMYQQANASAKAYKYGKLLEPWLLKKRIISDGVNLSNLGNEDQYIDSIECNGIDPNGFIKYLESLPEVEYNEDEDEE